MDRVSGRTDDMLIIRGVNVFPSQVEAVLLMSSPKVEPYYRLIVDRKGSLDVMEVQVEISPWLYKEVSEAILSLDDVTMFTEHETLVDLKQRIQKNIKDIIGITVIVTFKEPGSIERSEGKSKRVLDLRRQRNRA
jgi:phenylacetate-CoA ligase